MDSRRIARFEKVSFTQFENDWKGRFPEDSFEKIKQIYEDIRLPRRATAASAGYDFFTPVSLHLKGGESFMIPTGIRVEMDPSWVLCCFPRSGLGFKYRMQMDNTVGIIDADYYGSDNEGHIFAKFTCDDRNGRELDLSAGDAFMQGLFLPYGITEDDDVSTLRNGGLGSTDQ